MKASRYNYRFEEGNIVYWYNTLTDKGFKLPLSLAQKVLSLSNDPAEFKEVIPSLYNKFVESGFLIEDDFDEINVIRQRFSAQIDSDMAFLIIMPTLNCNYSCWYCIQTHVPTLMCDEVIEKVKRHIVYLLDEKKIKFLHIDWFGGEPLMFFRQVIIPISEFAVRECRKRKVEFQNGATTNAYFLTPNIFDDLIALDFKTFQITIDGNRENHDTVKFQKGLDSAFDHALRNINALLHKSDQFFIILRINYTHDNMTYDIVDQICEFIEPDVRDRVRITPRKVWQEEVDKSFRDKILSILAGFAQEGYSVEEWKPDWGYPCYAQHQNYKAINYNGDLVKCTASDNLHLRERADGTINDNGIAVWENGIQERYTSATFESERCLSCIFLPYCGGLCPKSYQNNPEYCKYDAMDENIDILIRQYVKSITL